MRRLSRTITCFVLLPVSAASQQQSDIIVDGLFNDWEHRSPIYTDSRDQPAGAIDLERLWAANDDRFLFLSIVVGTEEISLQDESSVTLLLDTDNDRTTGRQTAGIGAELVWVFGDRAGVFYGSNTVAVNHRDIGLIPAPTVTSTRFEMALDLHADPRRRGPLFPQDTVGIALQTFDGRDILPDPGDRVEFVIDRTVPQRDYDYDLIRELSSDIRVLAWNIERDGLFEDGLANDFRGLLSTIDPDIVGFSEIYEHSVGQTLDRLETLLPSDTGEIWFGDGLGFDIVLASRYPITRSFKNFSQGSVAAFLLDISRAGADALVVVLAHLRCCEADAERQRQVDEMMAFIRDSKMDGTLAPNTPIVLLGDMNFVGDSAQLETIVNGDIVNTRYRPSFDPDWDGTSFTDRIPNTTGVPAAYTWPGTNSDFSPGRLDFIVFSDFVMEAGKAFALNTPTIPLDVLRRLELSAAYTSRASDHLPVVADFRTPSVTARDDERPSSAGGSNLAGVYPNPASRVIYVKVDESVGPWIVSVSDVLGRSVLENRPMPHEGGGGVLHLSVDDLSSGLYMVRVRSASGLALGSATVMIR